MHTAFATTTRGLNFDLPPMRLFEKAKRFGVWNPADIDFRQDRADWQGLTAEEQDILLRLAALFQAGEEAVTLDLLPLIVAMARQGRLEDEIYLTSFLWEEAKHVEFFQRFFAEVAGLPPDLSRYHSPSYRSLFYEALPTAMNRLLDDPSPEAQVRASVTYNMVVEGVLAETGYHGYFSALQRNGLMPGQVRGIQLLKQDESRHIAYGIYLISRLVAEDPALWSVAEDTMNELLPLALDIIGDVFAPYDPVPFGLRLEDFTDFAIGQFQKRMARIEAARGATAAEVQQVAIAAIEGDDA
ncbi:MAG: R2-like ligand-binding oxidase [Caldilineales bacterium]|nr:R2-like ligand-binding oxidase [Caldilineales bacterium]MDW8318280.1 R2-like ligand-binding oxidase [Anaerolineae bacterium]